MFKIDLKVILFTLLVGVLIICSVVLAVLYFIIYPASIMKGNGVTTSEKRDLTKFSKIIVGDKITINITQATSDENVEVKAEDNIIKQIKTEVSGDTLYINFARQSIFGLQTIDPSKEVIVNLNYKDLTDISISGSVILQSTNKVRVDKLNLNQSGSTVSTLDLFSNSLNVNMSATSTATITGSATNQELNVSGSIKYVASELDSKNVKVSVSGDGSVKVRADESLDMNVSGAGTIEYSGSPKKLTQNISGTGTVKQANN